MEVCDPSSMEGGGGGVSIYLRYKKRMILDGAGIVLLIIQKI